MYNYDSDIVASYPFGLLGCNVERSTTKRELITIENTRTGNWRRANLNLLSGNVNALEFVWEMHHMPTVSEMVEAARI